MITIKRPITFENLFRGQFERIDRLYKAAGTQVEVVRKYRNGTIQIRLLGPARGLQAYVTAFDISEG